MKRFQSSFCLWDCLRLLRNLFAIPSLLLDPLIWFLNQIHLLPQKLNLLLFETQLKEFEVELLDYWPMCFEIVYHISIKICDSLVIQNNLVSKRIIGWHKNLILFIKILIFIGDQHQVLLELSIINLSLLLLQLLLIKLKLRICHCKELFSLIKKRSWLCI